MNEQTREVKGIFIPIGIWTDGNLTWNEKILFMEIDSFTSKEKDCYISNEYIAKLLGVTETSANRILSSLINKGYVIKTRFDGRKRWVKAALSFVTRQGCLESQGRVVDKDNIPNDNLPKEKEEHSSSKESAGKSVFAEEKTWRNDFGIYLKETNAAKEKLKADNVYRAQMEGVHENVDYDKTLDNMVYSYWGLEEAWQKKCKAKSKNMDMIATLKKNFDKNIVFKPRKYGTPRYTPSIAAEPVKVNNPQNDNKREDGTWIEGGRVTYRMANGQIDYIDELSPEQVPMRPDDKHDWFIKYKRWVVDFGDGTIIVNGERWYQSDNDNKWHKIPMNAPERDRLYVEYNYETNSWDL